MATVAASVNVRQTWTADERNLLRQWKREAIVRADEHQRMTRIHRTCDRVCGSVEAVLTAAATVIVFLTVPGESSPICAGGGVHAQWILVSAGVASAIALCAIGVDNVFHFSCMTEKHARAKSRLSGFVRYVDETLRIDPMTRGGAAHTLDLVRRRLDNITDDAPHVRVRPMPAPTPTLESMVRLEMHSPGAASEFECAADELSGAMAATASAFTSESATDSPFASTSYETAPSGSTPDRARCFDRRPPASPLRIGSADERGDDSVL